MSNNKQGKSEEIKELQEKSRDAVKDNRVTQIELLKVNPK